MPGFFINNADNDQISTDEECGQLDAWPAGFTYDKVTSPRPDIESARSYRWLFNTFLPFTGGQLGATGVKTAAPGNLLVYLKKADRPSMEFDEISIHNGPRTTYRPGKFKCNPIGIEFYEIFGPANYVDGPAVRMYEWMKRAIFKSRASMYSSYKDFTFDARLSMLDGAGRPVHIYELYNCFPTKVTPSELNSESDGIASITATIRYDDYREMIVKGASPTEIA
jgi:hypothetical protein